MTLAEATTKAATLAPTAQRITRVWDVVNGYVLLVRDETGRVDEIRGKRRKTARGRVES